MADIEIVWPAELDLGEGPLWHAESGRFYFVDIHGCAIHAWSPTTGERQSWKTPERIGWLIPRKDGDGFMAGLQSGFARLWLEPVLRLESVGCPHPALPDVRLNDAKADRSGRIWAGSMNNRDPGLRQGQLTLLDTNGQFTVVESDIYIANGPAIADDGSWMLHNDSYRNTTYRYSLGVDGALTDKTVWRKFSAKEATPDGMTMDRDGNVWIAFWGGACIRQFTPDAQLIQQIDLPAPQITSMAFGGEHLDVLLVTSARNGLSAQQLAQYPQAGSVFAVRSGVVGVLPFVYGA
jgi:D-xylonolactonase